MGKEKFTPSLLDFLLFLALVFLILSNNTLHPFTLYSTTILRSLAYNIFSCTGIHIIYKMRPWKARA